MGKTTIAAVFAALIAMTIGLASCGGSDSIAEPTPGLDLPWPPAESQIKFASDDSFVLNGNNTTAFGGDAFAQPFPPNSLYLGDEGQFSWATYGLAGFSETLEIASLTFNCEFNPVGPGDGSELYLGYANYTTGNWEWLAPGDGISVHDFPDDTDYLSPAGSVNFAVIFLSTEANAYTNILSLEIARSGNTDIAPPTGLAAVADLDEIELTWQANVTADGYHIYRDIHKDFLAPVKLTDGAPVTELTYLDETMDRGVMYYYKASSTQGVAESGLSGYVDIFAPESTRDMPTPLGGYSQGADDYNVQWSWSGSFPDEFWVYFSEEPDFNLDGLTPEVVIGIYDEAKLDLKDVGDTIYWRVCAYQSGRHGAMTDDMIGQTTNMWTWESPEVLGSGSAPLSLIKVDGDYSAAFINGTDVDFSRRTAGIWATETAMGADTFGSNLAMSYSGSEYLIGVQDDQAADLWIGTGVPGSFSGARVHGDNAEGMGTAASGNSIQAASSATEHVIIHSGVGNVMLHTKPVGSGSWSTPTTLWTAGTISDHMSIMEMDSNFHLLWHDPAGDELMLADKNGGWAQTNILGAAVPGIGEYNCLTRFDNEWWTPVYDSTPGERQIRFLNGTTPPWADTLQQDTGNVGQFASMAALDTKLFCTYYRQDADAWEFALYDGATWETNWLILPGNIVFSRAEAGGFGDVPFVLVDDTMAVQVKAFTGVPPA